MLDNAGEQSQGDMDDSLNSTKHVWSRLEISWILKRHLLINVRHEAVHGIDVRVLALLAPRRALRLVPTGVSVRRALPNDTPRNLHAPDPTRLTADGSEHLLQLHAASTGVLVVYASSLTLCT